MTTLIIHAPDRRVKSGAKSFEAVLADGVGVGYAISQEHAKILVPGSDVVVLRKDKNKKRAEGSLIKLVSTSRKTPQGIQRYNVHCKGLRVVAYVLS